MIRCLHCSKEFEGKRQSAKFCSDNCRVLNHQKNGKGNKVKPLNLVFILNEIKAQLNRFDETLKMFDMKIQDLTIPTHQIKPITDTKSQSNVIHSVPAKEATKPLSRTPEEWLKLKRECETDEQYQEWLTDLHKDPLLPVGDKRRIIRA